MNSNRKSFILSAIVGFMFGTLLIQGSSCIVKGSEYNINAQPKPLGWPDDYNIFRAIRIVESGGDDNAVGDGGRSKGPYQISRPYWQDANEHLARHNRRTYDYDTGVWCSLTSEKIMSAYWHRYGAINNEQRARMHNGGPRGHLRDSTLSYWMRVEKQLNKLGRE